MKTILIAGGEENIRNLIQETLEAPNRRILKAGTVLGVLDLVRKERPDLIVLDEVTPGLDGLVVLEVLRKEPGTADIRVVLLMARGQEERRQVTSRGGNACFIKPFNPSELLHTVEQLLQQEMGRLERNAASSGGRKS